MARVETQNVCLSTQLYKNSQKQLNKLKQIHKIRKSVQKLPFIIKLNNYQLFFILLNRPIPIKTPASSLFHYPITIDLMKLIIIFYNVPFSSQWRHIFPVFPTDNFNWNQTIPWQMSSNYRKMSRTSI